MRKIKFRYWNKEKDQYVKQEFMQYQPEQVMTFGKHIIIEQYTGLKDKHGIEIYEGDIVRYGKDEPQEVVFKDCCFGVYLKHNKTIVRLKIFDDINKFEIIGNIHERTK